MMDKGDAVTQLILTIFRLNGALIEAGNRLVKDIGLTSAWWQVLGGLALSPVPLTVSHIARNMGLSRQSVQRVADLLAGKGLVQYEANPHHRRAPLMVLTRQGAAVFKEASKRQRPWALDMVAGLSKDRIDAALAVLRQMDQHLAHTQNRESGAA
ncbi:MAG TPA: MarR family transcriptional regulator [Bauldia sp.]|nr:MarR family transcriptional regulator [Bauldia sp.]